jgi:cytochrome c biogenesis protein CcdA
MRLAISIAAVLVALVAAFVAIGFFALALYQFLAENMDPALAALATGVIILLGAMVLVYASKFLGRKRKKRRVLDDPSLAACESAAALGNVLGQKLRGYAEAHGNSTLWASLAAGFAVGASPKLRGFLRDILKL